ncbi:DUF362 domain-containing protein [bacterium]|nr:DUF362 domain-containing protein [candidate division CSSED10-310 bacterium]
MKEATVCFASTRAVRMRGLLQRLPDLIDAVGLDFVSKDSLVAIKCHFGERGCTTFIRPVFIRAVVEKVLARGAVPFLTDTATLYRSARRDGARYLHQAVQHGFTYATVLAPIMIADGLKSENVVTVPLDERAVHFRQVEIAGATQAADAMIVISHLKGHLVAGFGGAIKNLSMGLSSRSCKQRMHASVKPEFNEKRCVGCGVCADVCPEEAVTVVDGVAHFDLAKCSGCAECITHCEYGALHILWNERPEVMQEKMAEVAAGVMTGKSERTLFITFVLDVTPDCDCFPCSDRAIVPDIGVFASMDPVACDQAAVDAVNGMPGIHDTELRSGFEPGGDKLRGMRPDIDWTAQLAHAERLGLGTRRYRLQTVE